MRSLHVLPSVDLKLGGPVQSVLQAGPRLGLFGISADVVCLDSPDAEFITDFELKVYALGPSAGNYRYSDKLVPWLKENIARYDVVFIHGIWQYHSYGTWRVLRKTNIPYYVFTHGMMDPWFKHNYPLKHIKKWLYWPWADYRVLRDARCVLFTSDEERILARQSFWLYNVREKIVAYGSGTPLADKERLKNKFLTIYPGLVGKRIVVFLGRIDEKKGCDILIQAFARVAKSEPTLHLLMAGPDRRGLVRKLTQLAFKCDISNGITWTGMLEGEAKWGALYSGEVFVLPSHQENFGVAVVEALSCGLPVLISNKVNIWREIAADSAGFVDSDTVDGTERNLRAWLKLNAYERSVMSARSIETYKERFTLDGMANSLAQLIKSPDS